MKTKPNWNEAPEWATELRLDSDGSYRFLGNGMVTYRDGSHHKDKLFAEIWGELVEYRPNPFTINRGDYIDSREFTREECERFCELAVECGFVGGEFNLYYETKIECLGVGKNDDSLFWEYSTYNGFINNITTKFREFLDNEKDMSKFTKDDLKDGMRCTDREGDVWYVCGDFLIVPDEYTEHKTGWNDDLTDKDGNALTGGNIPANDIIRVTDRDGTVLFEREP